MTEPLSEHTRAPRLTHTRDVVICTLSLALLLATTTLMNATVFPLFDPIFTYTRDISVTCGAVALILLGLAAYRLPHLLTPRSFAAGAFAFLIVGDVALTLGLLSKTTALIIIGASVSSVGRAGATVLIGLALSRLTQAGATIAICVAFIAQFVLGEGLINLPLAIPYVAFCIYTLTTAALSIKRGLPLIELAHHSEAPHDLAVVRPASFLAPFSALFVCLFLFQLAFGFSLRFGEVAGTPQYSVVCIIPPVLLAGYVLISRKRYPADLMVEVSALFIIAGFLLVAGNVLEHSKGAVSLLSIGNTLFSMTAWLALVAISARNPVGATTTMAWGRGVSSLGTLVGAAAAVRANAAIAAETSLEFVIAGVLLMAFAAYVIIGLKHFGFSEVIEGVQPLPEQTEVRTTAELFQAQCEAIAQTYHLTPREAEVFAMLAKGRNREYIESELVVSRNTVKAHVKHIYTKLGIHSHQQLLDLMESTSPDALQ